MISSGAKSGAGMGAANMAPILNAYRGHIRPDTQATEIILDLAGAAFQSPAVRPGSKT